MFRWFSKPSPLQPPGEENDNSEEDEHVRSYAVQSLLCAMQYCNLCLERSTQDHIACGTNKDGFERILPQLVHLLPWAEAKKSPTSLLFQELQPPMLMFSMIAPSSTEEDNDEHQKATVSGLLGRDGSLRSLRDWDAYCCSTLFHNFVTTTRFDLTQLVVDGYMDTLRVTPISDSDTTPVIVASSSNKNGVEVHICHNESNDSDAGTGTGSDSLSTGKDVSIVKSKRNLLLYLSNAVTSTTGTSMLQNGKKDVITTSSRNGSSNSGTTCGDDGLLPYLIKRCCYDCTVGSIRQTSERNTAENNNDRPTSSFYRLFWLLKSAALRELQRAERNIDVKEASIISTKSFYPLAEALCVFVAHFLGHDDDDSEVATSALSTLDRSLLFPYLDCIFAAIRVGIDRDDDLTILYNLLTWDRNNIEMTKDTHNNNDNINNSSSNGNVQNGGSNGIRGKCNKATDRSAGSSSGDTVAREGNDEGKPGDDSFSTWRDVAPRSSALTAETVFAFCHRTINKRPSGGDDLDVATTTIPLLKSPTTTVGNGLDVENNRVVQKNTRRYALWPDRLAYARKFLSTDDARNKLDQLAAASTPPIISPRQVGLRSRTLEHHSCPSPCVLRNEEQKTATNTSTAVLVATKNHPSSYLTAMQLARQCRLVDCIRRAVAEVHTHAHILWQKPESQNERNTRLRRALQEQLMPIRQRFDGTGRPNDTPMNMPSETATRSSSVKNGQKKHEIGDKTVQLSNGRSNVNGIETDAFSHDDNGDIYSSRQTLFIDNDGLQRPCGSSRREDSAHSSSELFNDGDGIWPVGSPLHPVSVVLVDINLDQCRILRSSKYPAVIAFKATNHSHGYNFNSHNQKSTSFQPQSDNNTNLADDSNSFSYSMLYKRDDDVRQDELVLQLIGLVDYLLKAHDLDMHVTTYQVISLGHDEGLIEWVDGARPLSSIIGRVLHLLLLILLFIYALIIVCRPFLSFLTVTEDFSVHTSAKNAQQQQQQRNPYQTHQKCHRRESTDENMGGGSSSSSSSGIVADDDGRLIIDSSGSSVGSMIITLATAQDKDDHDHDDDHNHAVTSTSRRPSSLTGTISSPIQAYLRTLHYSHTDDYGIDRRIMEVFVRSCACYTVLTYVLGVGDRHLDNLMLNGATGQFFHVDFGYIFGRDPKPFAPPVRFPQEVLIAMGGAESQLFEKFLRLCCDVYHVLRRHAGAIFSLIRLMVDAGITDLSEKQLPEEALTCVRDHLKLELQDDAAAIHLRSVIRDSATSFMPVVLEHVHKFAVQLL